MRQVTQKLKTGEIKVIEVPMPSLNYGGILVRNYYSVISAGTEGSTVKTARKGLIGKARERPAQVRQVIDVLRSQGPIQTYRAVMKKLDAHSPLGYSCSGEVIGVGAGVSEFNVGDRVACGGLSACHAEIVSVPANLCIKLAPEAALEPAAYNTLGAIALQGVRQADLRLGETCAVIGLGLLGQLTCLMLKAAGVSCIGIDVDPGMVDTAALHCADWASLRSEAGLEEKITSFTGGMGCDAVIITAASDSLDPINFAGAIARKRGTVVIVGAVPTGFDREPHFYRKELQVRMSCSYGPGRYDPVYEDKGIDYPAAYVRWTEKRNMQAFQELVASGKIDVSYLTTHTFPLEQAPKAYDMMMERKEPFIGILIAYDTSKAIGRRQVEVCEAQRGIPSSDIGIGFIGAGSYAQSHLLPNIPKDKHISLKGVLTSSGTSARSVADRFGFEFCAAGEEDLFENAGINTLFVATRHDSHADYVLKSLKAGKHVFVEKPLCIQETELQEILEWLNRFEGAESQSPGGLVEPGANQPLLMVGYNRRFAPLALELKGAFSDMPMAMVYRINAGAIPADSWIQDPEMGGGRIIGEVCHFVDFLTFMAGSLPVRVHAAAMSDVEHLNDTLNISLTFENRSVGVISYLANGSKSLSKERIEVHGAGSSGVLDDFKKLTLFRGGKKQVKKLITQDKGQKAEVHRFLDSVRSGDPSPIPLSHLISTSLTTFRIMDAIRTGSSLPIVFSSGDPAS